MHQTVSQVNNLGQDPGSIPGASNSRLRDDRSVS